MKAKELLGKQRHITKHVPSMPYADVPKFYRWLCTQDTTTALALRFLILTATRTSEIRFARFDEIDGDIWIIAAERTKTARKHRVPLSAECMRIVEHMRTLHKHDLLFPNAKGNALSDVAMASLMKRKGLETRPHGFRSSFRVWAEEQTDAPYEIKELALGHAVGSQTERAYQRSDGLARRKELMNSWTDTLLETTND